MIQKIKEKLNKEEHQFITVEEFCAYAGFEPEKVKEVMID
ncbi:hypothetical protein BHF72_1405 [Cloacibacterium normanense]|uniref:Uncharacterized protein n=1 Tax=Cloacibacterium normanense TaxID=237258 RepID=A0A1E5UH56_9FLAO|nr:hypothetical protein BHF72_1405 [Cloacibacterium normanense]